MVCMWFVCGNSDIFPYLRRFAFRKKSTSCVLLQNGNGQAMQYEYNFTISPFPMSITLKNVPN